MSKLWHLYRGMPCCGRVGPLCLPIIQVVGETELSTIYSSARCAFCLTKLPRLTHILKSASGVYYVKAMYKPFDDGVVDEVLRETNERSESVQQVPSSVGHERPRTTAMQYRSRERAGAIWSGNELERRSVGASAQVLHRAHWPNLGKPTHNFGPKSRLVLLATEQSE